MPSLEMKARPLIYSFSIQLKQTVPQVTFCSLISVRLLRLCPRGLAMSHRQQWHLGKARLSIAYFLPAPPFANASLADCISGGT